jgi:energy-coupling factor transport system ATP-binding protein
MDTVIEFKNVTYTYPLAAKPAIKNMSFQIEKGGFYGVIGENGSGKTTLCSLIRGFAPSFYKGELEGEVLINGKETMEYGPGELALQIGYVFQNPFNQISGVKDTVFEEVAFGLENFGVDVDEIEQRVVDVMEMTDITAIAMKNPFELSGGQQQRVALASTIVLKPDILVIDEPTSQLDPEGTESVFKIISEMKRERKTIILVEHKVDLLAEYADEILVLKDSELIKTGTKQEILSDMSLVDDHVQLPQIAILGNELKKHGVALEQIPITEKQAAEVLKNMIAKGGNASGLHHA